MLFWQRWILKFPFLTKLASYLGIRGRLIKVNGGEIWYDCFGNPKDPSFLLLMGAGCQGILWTENFCRSLVEKGFFVIRFDNRDTGFSSYYNFKKNPYNLMDMALDAMALLKNLGIEKTHLFGLSMGGAVAQIIASYFPSYVHTVTLISTTNDFRPLAAVMEGKLSETFSLSSPAKEWFQWMKELESLPFLALKRKINKNLEGWEILNGTKLSFEREYYVNLMNESVRRQRSYSSFLNHRLVLLNSLDLVLETKGKIKVPCLIVHGLQDPLFPKDHAEYLAESIPGSSLMIIDRMGHNLNRCFYTQILEGVVALAKREKG